MITNIKAVKAGVELIDPIGRKHIVEDIFVPKNSRQKSATIPSSYRNMGRKVVVFTTGSIMKLSEAEQRYSLAS